MMDIDKLEAGRELDALVAEKVMGLKPCDSWIIQRYSPPEMMNFGCEHGVGKCYPRNLPLAYSTDIAMAWNVIGRVNNLGDWSVWQSGRGGWYASITFDLDVIADEIADTAPLAICRAALKAVKP